MSAMNINELNDDCLKDIFDFFDINQKQLLECVCLRWHQLIVQTFSAQKVLKIGLKSSLRDHYNCNDINYKIHECMSKLLLCLFCFQFLIKHFI